MIRQIKITDLISFAKILTQQTNFNEVLRLVANKSAQFLKADLVLILMVNPDTRETINTIIKDGKYYEQKAYRKIHINIGGWIINYKKSFLSKDIHKDKRFAKNSFEGVEFKSILGVPLIIEGVIFGAIILLYKKPSDLINSKTIEFLENIATISAPFLRNVQKIRQYFDSAMSENTLLEKFKNIGLLGKSSKFIELLHAVEAASKCDVRVLLDGKTGTGKELIAKSIHQFSSRANFPFVGIDCGAIPSNLLESELFGHKRGAFTGADSDRQGLFSEANGGTLFLDEINNMPIELQSKLLRVLQEGEIRPVGSDKSLKIDVRIITASSTSLKTLTDEKKFREDLFYRLHVYPISVLDLNERKEDIPLLAEYFLHKYAKHQNKNLVRFHEVIIDFMKQREWKGNIRELENFIERLVTLAPGNVEEISIESFPTDLSEELSRFREIQSCQKPVRSLKKLVQKYEAEIIKQTLIECDWNQSEAARRLDISEKSIRYQMSQLKIKQ